MNNRKSNKDNSSYNFIGIIIISIIILLLISVIANLIINPANFLKISLASISLSIFILISLILFIGYIIGQNKITLKKKEVEQWQKRRENILVDLKNNSTCLLMSYLKEYNWYFSNTSNNNKTLELEIKYDFFNESYYNNLLELFYFLFANFEESFFKINLKILEISPLGNFGCGENLVDFISIDKMEINKIDRLKFDLIEFKNKFSILNNNNIIKAFKSNSLDGLDKWFNKNHWDKYLLNVSARSYDINSKTLQVDFLLIDYSSVFKFICSIFDNFGEIIYNIKINIFERTKDIYGNRKDEILDKLSVPKDDFSKINRNGFDVDNLKVLFNQLNKYAENRREQISQSVKDSVWQRDRGRCVECGSKEYLEFDHIIPISKGGSNTSRNIQLLCQTCNRKKTNKIG